VEEKVTAGVTGYVRGGCGVFLMGLANLVPGIRGGTMLLAAGIYPAFIAAIAEVSRLKFRLRSLAFLAVVLGAALTALLLGAGPVKAMVVSHRWVMYSLFIGLTLGGVPIVWRLARPAGKSVYLGLAAGFAVMVVLGLGLGGGEGGGEPDPLLLFVAGVMGAAAMILPGISGGYLLLLLGQYENILGAIEKFKLGLTGGDSALLTSATTTALPVAIGVIVGVAGVSNLIKWLLEHREKPTLGVLLGLLFGAVVGLWPFQRGVAPQPGEIFRGEVLTAETLAELAPKDWPVSFFSPTPGQVLAALALIVLGFAVTMVIDRWGAARKTA